MIANIFRRIRSIAGNASGMWRKRGAVHTFRFFARRAFRYDHQLVIESGPEVRDASGVWDPNERVIVIRADNVSHEATPELLSFLAAREGEVDTLEDLDGVRRGNYLFVVADETGFLATCFVMFNHKLGKIYGEAGNPPLLFNAWTAPAARGRGINSRLRTEIEWNLQREGYERCIGLIKPTNTASIRSALKAGRRLSREVRVWIVLNRLVIRYCVESGRGRWQLSFL